MTPVPTLRRLGLDDGAELSELAARLFRQAYDGEMPGDELERYVAEEFTTEVQERELSGEDWITVAASVDGVDVGYVQVRSNTAPSTVDEAAGAELKRIYLDRAHHGQGVAVVLLDAGRDAARTLGHDRMWLSVWQGNPRAIAFYRKHGFEVVGDATFQMGGEEQWDHIMATDLAPATPSAEPPEPWTADRTLDADGALAAVEAEFPGLATEANELGSGWEFDTYGLGLEWVARFPRRAEVADRLETEVEVVERIAEALAAVGVEVPRTRGIGGATSHFPYRFLVQKRIWGMPLDALRRGRFHPMLARHLGEVLSTLHALPVGALAVASQPLQDRLDEVRGSAARLDPATAERVAGPLEWLGASAAPAEYVGPGRLTHNDLTPDHVRVARTGIRVIGLLDWSDVAAGDPARDFVSLRAWGGHDAYREVLSAYTPDRDAGFDERVEFLARVGSLKWLADAAVRGEDLERILVQVERAFANP